MKAIKVIKPGDMQIVEEEMPKIENPSDVLVKVKAAGICGSDISIFKGTSPVATYPRVIGHEFAGEVVEVGTEVTNVKVGDHVAINPVTSCGTCPACKKGRSNVCASLAVIGVHRDGGFREYAVVPGANAVKISKDVPWSQAGIVEPYTIAAQVVSRGNVQAGDSVLILGCGPIALTILQVSKMLGAKCIMSDIVDGRLERAKEFGADLVINSMTEDIKEKVMEATDGFGVNVAIDAACVGITLQQAVACTGAAGTVVTMGFSDKPSNIPELAITAKELDIKGSRLNNNMFPKVVEWIESGKVDNSRIITDNVNFEDVLIGFDKIKNDPENTLKVILNFD